MASNLMLFFVSLCMALALFIQADAQFFTKTSKSIPRMGRRSVEDPALSKHDRLMESLMREFGPNLLESLETKPSGLEDSQMAGYGGGTEFVNRDDQPFDLARVTQQQPLQYNGEDNGYVLPRDQRSASTKGSQTKDSSLAMRALNINRYMQHLASGQPLMPYDKLISGGQRVVASGNNGQQIKYDK